MITKKKKDKGIERTKYLMIWSGVEKGRRDNWEAISQTQTVELKYIKHLKTIIAAYDQVRVRNLKKKMYSGKS